MINFKSIPFLRLLFPYVLGICFSLTFGVLSNIHLLLMLSFLLCLITFGFQKFYLSPLYFKKAAYIVSANVFLFLLANEAFYLYKDTNRANHYTHFLNQQAQNFFVTVDDVPVKTDKGTKLPVSVECVEYQNQWRVVCGKIIVYLKNDSIRNFDVGDALLINAKYTTVSEPKNPNEFNYKRFLDNKNIFHVVYAKPEEVFITKPLLQKFSISQLGAQIKLKVVNTFRNSGLSKETFAICSALLVGYDDEIDSDIMRSFSHSGTLHVLSVSGMHTGILFGIFVFLFGLFDKHDKYKKLRCFLVVIALFLFVVITGFAPAVLRAALMLSLIVVGQTFYKQSNGFNTLFLSAFILLLTNPCLVTDVGFLLSYTAVFGIMYLYPLLSQRFYFDNWLLQKINSLTLMSVSATVFTLPISLYYFHQFPVWFVFSNLVIIPLSTVVMIGAITLLCLNQLVFFKTFLVGAINQLNALMLWFARLTDQPDFGYIDNIHFSTTDFLYLSLCIVLLLWIVHSRQYVTVRLFLMLCGAWLFTNLIFSYQQLQQKEFVVFFVKQKPAFVLRHGTEVYCYADSLTNAEMERYLNPYLLSLQQYNLRPVKTDLIKVDTVAIQFLNRKNQTLMSPALNYIVVSHNTSVNPLEFVKNKPMVIADCSNSYNFVKTLRQQCALAEVPFYSVKEQGALRIRL